MSVLDHAAFEQSLHDVEPPVSAINFLHVGPPNQFKDLLTQGQCNQVLLPYKYMELEMMAEGKKQVDASYGQHYVDPKTNIQVLDILDSIGSAEEFCRGAAIKYLCRYGKKQGYNRQDLLKAFHYIVLLMYFTRNRNKE